MKALAGELAALERLAKAADLSGDERISSISADLVAASLRADFPPHQLARWVWLGSQFRVHAASRSQVAVKSAAALQFLTKTLARAALTELDEQDLNWVLDSTIRELSQIVSPHDLRSCLTAHELAAVETRLSEFASTHRFDAAIVREKVAAHSATVRSFSRMADLADAHLKIESLFAAAEAGSTHAQAALLYLAEEDDVVGDQVGLLGLIDDIYVIEWAYAAVESQTRCLPILEALLSKWPYVADLGVLEGGRANLNRFSQYVSCAALDALFDCADKSILVVRETGAYPLLTTLMAAIECSRRQLVQLATDFDSWSLGDHIVISDGVRTFKATFEGHAEGDRFKIGVRDSGILYVGQGTLRYVARAAKAHSRLSRGNEIAAWLNDRHVDPLVHLNGSGLRRASRHEAVLLLGPRHKLDDLLPCLKPQGMSMQSLLGLRYVNAHQEAADARGSASDEPLVYACSDPAVALELLREPPEHVQGWRVIVDGARLARPFLAATVEAAEFSAVPVCAVVELAEREATSDLLRLGTNRLWYLEDQDVEVPFSASNAHAPDLLHRCLARRSAHWSAKQVVTQIRQGFLEEVAACLADRPRLRGADGDASVLDLSISTFLQKAIASVLPTRAQLDELNRLANSIRSQASVLRQYDDVAAKLYVCFSGTPPSEEFFQPRLNAVARLAAGSGRTAVVCRSVQIAEQCRSQARALPDLRSVEWLNIEQLRRNEAYDRVIVPAWLDRISMRELAFNGYAPRLDLVALPFEKKWFDTTTAAVRRWERSLERRTVACLADTAERLGQAPRLADAWRKQTEMRLAQDPAPEPQDDRDWSDEPEVEHLEARAIEAIARRAATSAGDAEARAQLVLFDEPGAYTFLPPQGRTIVLSEASGATDNAERQLMRGVAELRPGMVVALPVGGGRDLIDARADQLLDQSARVRSQAGLWRQALRRSLGRDDERIAEFAGAMRAAGQPRDSATIRYWMNYEYTTAPRSYKAVIPLIAKLTHDEQLSANVAACLSAIDLVYRARAKAAKLLIEELFRGEIDLSEPVLRFDTASGSVAFELHRVRRLGDVQSVPMRFLGKVGRITEALAA